jgi:hypothetical protein
MAEPKTLTESGLRALTKAELAEWAEGRCLLEHLDPDEVEALTKAALVDECMGALMRAEVYEDRRALATDTVSRPLEELIG